MTAFQEQILSELKTRVKQQTVEMEKAQVLQQKLTQEKAQLELQVASLSAELQEASRRCVKHPKERRLTDPNSTDLVLLLTVSRNTILQKEKEQQREQHEQTVQKHLAKHEMDVSHLHQEHALSAAKVHTNLRREKQQINLPSA